MPLSTAARNTMIDALTDLFDGGTLQVATDGTFSTILATFTLANPSCPSASSGTATASSISSVTAAATGNAEAFRIRNSSNTTVYDRSDTNAVSASGGGGVLVLNQATTGIVSGQTVSVSSLTFTMPAGT